ncbi:MAG: OsmC family protein [Planctomycetes bacterium]|nr:OsmC family protein [Planctomycetota bacterium]
MEREMVITFPDGKGVEASYKGTVIKIGPWEGWHEGSVPSPFDMFVFSLGLCGAANAFAFMTHRDIPLENTRIVLHRFTDREKRMITKFTFEVFLPADFPEKYRKAVVRAIEACSVKKHIVDAPEFIVEVKTG